MLTKLHIIQEADLSDRLRDQVLDQMMSWVWRRTQDYVRYPIERVLAEVEQPTWDNVGAS